MATDAVNGMDYSQYSQPAELAASTPSHQASASQSSNSAPSQKPDPQEIGWYFVEQYYTTLSKTPDKIHLFYNKKSQLITGVEAEKVLPAVGTKAISEKIKSLDISDCKVRVLNVDCQSSFENIVVQVIGEMSNKNQPHHKFVQTFILATQPNGYYVLNDIFRYLNDDDLDIVEDEPVQPTQSVQEEAASEAVEQEPVPTPGVAPAEEVVNTESTAGQVDEKLEAEAEAEAAIEDSGAPTAHTGPAEDVNGTHESVADASEAAEPEPTPAAEELEPEPVSQEAEQAPAEAEAEAEPSPAPAQAQTSPQPAQAPAAEPPVRKTWASLVGTKAPAIPALPQTQTQTQAQAQAPAGAPTQPKTRPVQTTQPSKATPTESVADTPGTPTSQQSNGWQEAGKKTKQQPKAQEGIVHAYIKNVNDKIDARVLREVLEKYGSLKYYDVSRPKQCAFVEFNDPASYTAAVADNPHTVGTETINVEERRPRPGAAGTGSFSGNFNRGGANAGRGRGGPQQRSGSQGGGFTRDGAGRGNFQPPRGNKPAGPARGGRGQSQAA
ncbi:hypothetical protein LTR70_009536 [Exophiala xenobiotica]|uniref:Uncharacterized protein n=1 Tax=Lithohypha guttulata TaxID=1690604 RepID=A0ABR0JYW5_9EURO|nr:hypothetical protein LTR24_009429 [Lithohypha guttulata]KAK5310363.1 hypothetical protein LTR70_009536 [Exophiala xenobiotica]